MLAYPLTAVIVLQTLTAAPHAERNVLNGAILAQSFFTMAPPPADFRFELEMVPEGCVVKAIIFGRGVRHVFGSPVY